METLEVEESVLLSKPSHHHSERKVLSCKSFTLGFASGCLVGVVLFLGFYLGLPRKEVSSETAGSSKYYAEMSHKGIFANAAIASDAKPCSTIGKQILQNGGSAVDSAIATMLCACVHNMHSCGIGGGFFMIYYEAKTGRATFVNARETAPHFSTENMFHGNGKLSQLGTLSVGVPGEIAGYWEAHKRFGKLPWADLFAPTINMIEHGFFIGPALARAIVVNEHWIKNRTFNLWPIYENEDGSLKKQGDIIRLPLLATTLRKLAAEGAKAFYNGSLTPDIIADLKDGYGTNIIDSYDLLHYRLVLLKIGKTGFVGCCKYQKTRRLTKINDMSHTWLCGPILIGQSKVAAYCNTFRDIVGHLQPRVKIPQVVPAINVSIDSTTVYSPGPPGGGAVLSLILNILDGYDFTPAALSNENKVLTYHRIVEAFRFAFAKRSSLGDDPTDNAIAELVRNMTEDGYAETLRMEISDRQTHPVKYYRPGFELPEDFGTDHLSLYAPNGDGVSMTSSVNLYFGSKVRGRRTGIIFNNVMDDFSSPNVTNYFGLPPSPSNFIRPGKRPMSSMTPVIAVKTDPLTKKRKVQMISGAAGGTKIISATALTLMNCLWFGDNVSTSVERKRLHDQLMPNVTQFEKGFDQVVINGLSSKGHETKAKPLGKTAVQAVLIKEDGTVLAASDSRKGGAPDGF